MPDISALVDQARDAYKAGRKQEAHSILVKVVDQDERNERAWLLLSAVVDNLEEQQICLENVLSLNPSNKQARKGLAMVHERLAQAGHLPPTSPPPPPSPPSPSPTSASQEFEDASFGSWTTDAGSSVPDMSPDRSNAFETDGDAFFSQFSGRGSDSRRNSTPSVEESFDSWLASSLDGSSDAVPGPPPEPSRSSSSVDWSRDSGTAAYGSGRDVELPSEQEYDSWLAGLRLENNGNQSPSPQPPVPPVTSQSDFGRPIPGSPTSSANASPFVGADQTGPFSDSSFMFEDESPAGATAPPGGSNPFGDDMESSYGQQDSGWASDGGSKATNGYAFDQSYETLSEASPFGDADFFVDDALPAQGGTGMAGFGTDDGAFARGDASADSVLSGSSSFLASASGSVDEYPDQVLSKSQQAQTVISAQQSSVDLEKAEYFEYIPDDIVPYTAGSSIRGLLLVAGIVVLLALNAGSLLLLVQAL